MSISDIREKLHLYIETAGEKKVKAIYTMVEAELVDTHTHWANDSFVEELKRREKRYLDGESKSKTLEEAIKSARRAIKKVKHS